MEQVVRLGNFALDKVIGRGGMGEVWRGVHLPSGVPAAVKFDLNDADAEYRAAFFHEVRLVAGLDHPNCVHVLDAGTVGARDEMAVEGRMKPGAPWLAMELAPAGAMRRRNAPRTWREALHVLRSLLHALQHAHSRGVIHRDIKFGNLLLAGPPGDLATVPRTYAEARIVLSDFGISHLLERPVRDDAAHSSGTPQYMAPEQIQGDWRAQGPWTDLYQVGVLGWCLATGSFPFRGHRTMQILAAHMSHRPPPFEPVMDVPPGVEDILRRMLEKRPADRYRFAAEVLEALEALAPVAGAAARRGDDLEEELPTISLRSARAGPERSPGTGTERRPGTGLWGLKRLPLMGRGPEQERLQIALRRVVARGRHDLVAITGPAGTGRTRLAGWLREWAHAEGLAESVLATHGPRPEAGSGLLAGVARYFRVDGLRGAALRERLAGTVGEGPYGDVLERLLAGERVALAARRKALAVSLRRAAREVPLVVVLDDVHHDPEAVGTVAAILADLDAHPAPILVVLTAADEGLAENRDADRALEQLLAEREAERIALGPLEPGMHRALVRSLLGLEGSVAERVERRSAGNPALAVQWVGYWVENGWLVPGRRGLELAPDAPTRLPDDMLAAWRARVERFLGDRPEADRTALQLAAILGHGFDVAEWVEACRTARVLPTEDLVADLIRARLAAAEHGRMGRVRFSHALVVAALRDAARSGPRWVRLNAAAAAAVRAGPRPDPERLADLHSEAGQFDEAVDAMRWACENQLVASDARSTAMLERHRATLARLGAPPDDPRHADTDLLEAWTHRLRNEFDRAEAAARRALTAGETHGWPMVQARALRELGQQAVALGKFEPALGYFHRAARLASDAGRPVFASHCVLNEGDALLFLGRLDDAREAFAEVADAFEGTDAERLLSHEPHVGLANAAIRSGELDAARRHLGVARDRAERARLHGAVARIVNLQGEVARLAGDLDEAVRLYAEAAERYRALEHAHGAWPELNVGLCLVLRARWDEAAARMRRLLREVRGIPVLAACARVVWWAACAGGGDGERFEELYEPIAAFFASSHLAEKDLATLAGIAAEQALARGWANGAARALELQADQLDRLGQAAERDRVRARLAALRRR